MFCNWIGRKGKEQHARQEDTGAKQAYSTQGPATTPWCSRYFLFVSSPAIAVISEHCSGTTLFAENASQQRLQTPPRESDTLRNPRSQPPLIYISAPRQSPIHSTHSHPLTRSLPHNISSRPSIRTAGTWVGRGRFIKYLSSRPGRRSARRRPAARP